MINQYILFRHLPEKGIQIFGKAGMTQTKKGILCVCLTITSLFCYAYSAKTRHSFL